MERTTIREILLRLEDAGFEAWLVGGCVRDQLMGDLPHDYDITTSARPEEIIDAFPEHRVIETGLKHGTVTLLFEGEPIEITTFRAEGVYSDHRHPDEVIFTQSLQNDLSRRDFTMNAIAVDARGKIADPFGGKQDIENKIIRCVGNAEQRFEEDALRILRGLRFAATLGFSIDTETKSAMEKKKDLLSFVSAERVASELSKLLCGDNVREVLMENIHVIGTVIPELLPMVKFDQKNYHHIYDVLEHTARVVEKVPSDLTSRWAALFHDVGKPSCFTTDNAGVGHFYGHAERSREIASSVFQRLHFDKATMKAVDELIRYHDTPIEISEKAIRRALGKIGPDGFMQLLQLKRADNLAQNPVFLERQTEYDRIEKIAAEILEQSKCFCLRDLALDGRDIIALGVPSGKRIGEILQFLLDAVLNEQIPNERDELIREVKRIIG